MKDSPVPGEKIFEIRIALKKKAATVNCKLFN